MKQESEKKKKKQKSLHTNSDKNGKIHFKKHKYFEKKTSLTLVSIYWKVETI